MFLQDGTVLRSTKFFFAALETQQDAREKRHRGYKPLLQKVGFAFVLLRVFAPAFRGIRVGQSQHAPSKAAHRG
jgi:hypothetical protein